MLWKWKKATFSPPRGFTHSFLFEGVMSAYVGVSKIGVPQNGWFIMENLIKMDDLGVPPFSETPMWRWLCFIVLSTKNSECAQKLQSPKVTPWIPSYTHTHTHIYIYSMCFFILATLYKVTIILGGFFNSNVFWCSPWSLGRWSNFTVAYFSKGLVQPPTRIPLL